MSLKKNLSLVRLTFIENHSLVLDYLTYVDVHSLSFSMYDDFYLCFSTVMASNVQCIPCFRLDKSASADKCCVDCEESLCKDCVTAHMGNKVSMRHHIIDLKVATTILGKSLLSQNKCLSHPDFTMDFFCASHDDLCCRHCMSDRHRSCDRVVPLEVASKDVKTSTLCHDIADEMNQILTSFNGIIQNSLKINQRNGDEEKRIVQEISDAKASLIEKLNQLEKITLSELREARWNTVKMVDTHKIKSEGSVEVIKKYLKQLDILTTNGTDQHVFLFLHELQPVVNKQRDCLEKLISILSEPRLCFSSGDVLLQCKGLGSITIMEEKAPLLFCPSKHLQAQIMTTVVQTPRSFKFKNRINIENGCVSGLTTDNDGNLLIVSADRMLSYSENGSYINECKLSDNAWDISFNPKSENAIVTLNTFEMQLVNNFSTKPVIKFKNWIWGISYGNDNIYGGDWNGNFHIFNTDVRHLKEIKIGKQFLSYVHHRSNKIYISETSFNMVYCLNEDGSVISIFYSPLLIGPNGITSDGAGNIYVVGRQSNNIHRLSADAKTSDIVLSDNEKIKDPLTLCFSKDYRKLFVSNQTGKHINIYECQY